MALKRFLIVLLLVSACQVLVRPAGAVAIATSEISFSNLTIAPASGSATLDGVWLLHAFASANNSLGQSDMKDDFALSPDTLSRTAKVIWAEATGTVTASGAPPDFAVLGGGSSDVDIPICDPAAAFATGIGTLSNSFTIGGTGMVDVQFGIQLAGMLKVLTDVCGLSARTETTFNLEVDGSRVLFFDKILAIGPSNHLEFLIDMPPITNTIALAAGVSHFLILQADSESDARTQVPEPPSGALLLISAGALLWGRWRRRRGGGVRSVADLSAAGFRA